MKEKNSRLITKAAIYIINKLWLLLATVIISTAVCFALLHIFLPQINYFKLDIENWIETTYQIDVDTENIDAEWRANGPIFSISKLKIKHNEQQSNLLSIDSMLIHLDGFNSLLTGSVTTEKIEISGAKVNFILDRKLGVKLNTLDDNIPTVENTEVESTSRLILVNLFNQKNLSLTESNININTLSGREFHYSIEQLDIINFEGKHQITGQLKDEFQGNIKLVAEIFGDPETDNSYTNFYLEGEDLLLSSLPSYKKNSRIKPNNGQLNWKLWSHWKDGRWQTAHGMLELSDINWCSKEIKNNSKNNKPNIESLSVNFNWQFAQADSGLLSFYDVQLKQLKQKVIQLPELYFLFQQKNVNDIQWDFMTHDFQVAPLVKYASIPFEVSAEQYHLLNAHKLNLNLNSFGMRILNEENSWQSPLVFSQFSQLNYNKELFVPAVDGLSGEIVFFDGVGDAFLHSKKTEIDFDDLFRNTIHLDEIDIKLAWSFDNKEQINLLVESAKFKNKDLTLQAKSRFFFQDDKPVLSLFAQLSDLDVSKKSLYLPTNIMSQSLTEYLDNSVKSGYISLAKAVVHGPLSAFPFDNEEGLFSVKADLKNALFEYIPDWPIANDLNVDLLFEGNGMDLYASAGTADKVLLNNARAVIKNFSAKNTPLELFLDVNSQDNTGREFLLKTPIKHIGESLTLLDYQGDIRTQLSIITGLDDSSILKLEGKVTPDKENSLLNIRDFKLTELDGDLLLNSNGIQLSHVKAKYHDAPLLVELQSPNHLTAAELIINVDGVFKSKALNDIVSPTWSQIVKGETPFSINIQIAPPKDKNAVLMKINSDLVGMNINLPEQFRKSFADKSPLEVNIRLDDVNEIKINWKKLAAKWWWNGQSSEYQYIGGAFSYDSEIQLTDIPIRKNQANIHLKSIQIEKWLPIFRKIKSELNNSHSSSKVPVEFVFKIDHVKSEFVDLSAMTLLAKTDELNLWSLTANSPEISGTLRFYDEKPWELQIEKLDLQLKSEFFSTLKEKTQHEKTATEKKVTDDHQLFKFHQWPQIDISCAECQIHNKILGNIQANLSTSKNKLNIQGTLTNDKKHQLVFNANWLQVETLKNEKKKIKSNNNEQSFKEISNLTRIEYQLSTNNIGQLMKRWNYPVPIKDSGGAFYGRLWWKDTPWNFSLTDFEGDARFKLNEGYLNEVSDVKARLFSLLSLQTLSRRLKLDFSDVYKKGFFYNKLSGNVRVRDGIVTADNIYVDGNAAKVNLNGLVDLKQQMIEQRAVVVPQLTSSLPVLIGWAVEPTTGLLVYLLNKVFEPAIEVVTQIEYRIHGSLDDLKVDQIKKSKSKVEYETSENKEKINKKTTTTTSQNIPSSNKTK